MSFNAEMLESEGVWQIVLSGHLDTTTAGELEKSLQTLLESPSCRILIDFTELEYISSSGLRVFLVAAKRVKQLGGRLVLCGMQEFIKNVFAVSGFLNFLDVVDDCTAASVQARA
jgi:anti-anti-sigma factor